MDLKVDQKKGLGDFGRMVEAARREVEAAGPWVVSPAKKRRIYSKTVGQKKMADQEDLRAAVMACDVSAAQAAVDGGADPRGEFSGLMGLFEEWVGAVAMSEGGFEPGVDSEAVKAMILWLDGQDVALSMGVGRAQAKKLGVARAERCADPAWRRACRTAEMKSMVEKAPVSSCAMLGEALGELAQHWGLDVQAKARVGPQAWMDELFKPNGEWLASEMLAVALGLRGARMSAQQWREMGERLLYDASDMNPAMMCDILRAHPPKLRLSEETLGLLMVHALSKDSLEELSELASKRAKPLWRLPTDVWAEMELLVPAHGLGPTLLEYAARLACDGGAQRRMECSGVATGMECLRALARIPEAIESLGAPEPGVFENATLAMMRLMEGTASAMLDPDEKGETFAHIWARQSVGDGPKKVVDLLATTMAPWALRQNKRGESAVSIVKGSKDAPRDVREKMDKAFVAYEERIMRAAVPAGRKGLAQPKAGRL